MEKARRCRTLKKGNETLNLEQGDKVPNLERGVKAPNEEVNPCFREWREEEIDNLVDILNVKGVGERALTEEEERRIVDNVLNKVDAKWRDQLIARILRAKK